MIIVGNTLVSEDIADVRFQCDCDACLGGCCVEGDAGAPLLDSEVKEIKEHIEAIKPFMRHEGMAVITSKGLVAIDPEGVKGTPLIKGRDCAFVVYKGKVATCAIEKAWEQKKIPFRKPVSCHLYPIRTTDYTDCEAVNYHEWDICKKALLAGRENNVYLFEFLKEPLIRKYGEAWYEELVMIIEYLKKKKLKR